MEYCIRYLSIARKDMMEIVDYVSEKLQAPKAALNLLDEFEKKIANLRSNPYANRLYRPSMPIDTEYRIVHVKNYLVFYVVIEDVIEIHRIIYEKRDLSMIIN